MEFRFTEEQQMIRDTAEAFLAEVSTPAAVREAMVTERGYSEALWQQISQEMMWPALHIPEAFGGLGLGFVELAAMQEQMGRTLLCAPFLSTVGFAVNALLVAGSEAQQSHYLGEIASGKTATLAFMAPGSRPDADAIQATCAADGDGFLLNGEYRYVLDGHTADILVLAARDPGSAGTAGVSLFVLPADTAGISRQWLPTMDQTRRQARIVLDKVRVEGDACMGAAGQAWPALAKILDLATVALAAEQVGVAQQSLDSSVAYTTERVQFGRTIASYQAIKHKAADMMLKVEAARSAAYYAACIADEALAGRPLGSGLAEAASIAKAYCSEAAFFNAGCGIQLHGGVGITAEYDIQLYFKRAKSTETLLGDAAWHRERLARQLLDGGVA
ncbi:MAG: acyl-CoA dehydrogenase [Haliea sp.]|uniref:acyl-CoA dehydrogenase family protein n=1 Tax=Haliea sp. TaxID=1932666 RepID=UPI000C53D0E3|nr:acyl-CoA dehydrogenase family protein [Haliea sp.]MBM69869.1 acyl-CoA dehydrogenase [Haliea sp.]|tara:strand:- start:14926 stop:16092 length:1167 start_codon:yes stop_codon:yes gene_type:complete